ncbi:helix-turn-helix domain-containing protein [Salicibibacter cibarius]|uniref:DNA-binding protein n=2 Tax=Salicibibacter TaxID=2685905 RepID=A0A514LJI1_9BACI|nr:MULTISPECIES: helix-turn-helix domain-containing protein [Salicibibacter]QDI92007.1 DNA-binding protein [Salicibibacter halophilus]QQK74542.1 helix-turn-helix domain-containing protein [Salicibibacter cibarius]
MSIEETIQKAVQEAIQPLEEKLDKLTVHDDPYPRRLTVKEAAEILRVSENRVRELANYVEGFPSTRAEGEKSRIYIPRDRLYQWIENNYELIP